MLAALLQLEVPNGTLHKYVFSGSLFDTLSGAVKKHKDNHPWGGGPYFKTVKTHPSTVRRVKPDPTPGAQPPTKPPAAAMHGDRGGEGEGEGGLVSRSGAKKHASLGSRSFM